MAQLRVIKNRMGAVKTIERITKTMQMIATAKFTAASQRAAATKPYTERISDLVHEVSVNAPEYDSPLVKGPSDPVKREYMLVISSDRGMCGAYNGNIFKLALQHIRACKEAGIELEIEVSGKKAVNFFRFQRIDVRERYELGDKPEFEAVEQIADKVISEFGEGRYDAARVIYMRFISNSQQVPTVTQLLPMGRPEEEGSASEAEGPAVVYDFTPSVDELLDELLPRMIKTVLFQSFNDSSVSEQMMRMVAMKAATENAKDFGRTLKRKFNRARQSQITTELTEIISGAAALE
ncbi:MAG: ATP synthase F1 subunit gamma [Phycisphaerales bacterium]|nr:ATP synthase F1 subunit gamma [Phycisphaerales bacterium]